MNRITTAALLAILAFGCGPKNTVIEETQITASTAIATCGTPAPTNLVSTKPYELKPIKLIPEALGVFERPVQTQSKEAQDFFNQGFQLRYAFAVNEAISSFREAQKADTTCVMCYWGEAWALGSYINGHMKENKAALALEAINKAKALVDENTTEVDRALIEAMGTRYIKDFKYDTRRNQDSLYADAMKVVHERFPDDLDVATLYADALFLLEPRGGRREMDNPRLMKMHRALEFVLEKKHPTSWCMSFIHSCD